MAKKRKTKTKSAAKKGAKKTKRRKKKQARAASQSSTSNDVDDCVKRAGASRRAVSVSPSCFDTAGLDRRQRASARQGFELRQSAHCGQRRRGGNGDFPYLAAAGQSAGGSEPGLSPTPLIFLRIDAAPAMTTESHDGATLGC